MAMLVLFSNHQLWARMVKLPVVRIFGWVPYPIPNDVLLNTRMYVNRAQVEDIVAHLMIWLRTGSLNYD